MNGVPVDLRNELFRRDVPHLHQFAPRAVTEFLGRAHARHLIHTEVEQALTRYATIDPALLKALEIDR